MSPEYVLYHSVTEKVNCYDVYSFFVHCPVCYSLLFSIFQFMAGFLILILSILSDLLKCEWGLSVEEEALLTSVSSHFF